MTDLATFLETRERVLQRIQAEKIRRATCDTPQGRLAMAYAARWTRPRVYVFNAESRRAARDRLAVSRKTQAPSSRTGSSPA